MTWVAALVSWVLVCLFVCIFVRVCTRMMVSERVFVYTERPKLKPITVPSLRACRYFVWHLNCFCVFVYHSRYRRGTIIMGCPIKNECLWTRLKETIIWLYILYISRHQLVESRRRHSISERFRLSFLYRHYYKLVSYILSIEAINSYIDCHSDDVYIVLVGI